MAKKTTTKTEKKDEAPTNAELAERIEALEKAVKSLRGPA